MPKPSLNQTLKKITELAALHAKESDDKQAEIIEQQAESEMYKYFRENDIPVGSFTLKEMEVEEDKKEFIWHAYFWGILETLSNNELQVEDLSAEFMEVAMHYIESFGWEDQV